MKTCFDLNLRMIEPEIAFADLQEDMEIAEGFLKSNTCQLCYKPYACYSALRSRPRVHPFDRFVINFAMEKCPEDFKILENFEILHLATRKKELEKEVIYRSLARFLAHTR